MYLHLLGDGLVQRQPVFLEGGESVRGHVYLQCAREVDGGGMPQGDMKRGGCGAGRREGKRGRQHTLGW